MASQNNFFALLGDDENDDPAALIARAVSLKSADKPSEPPGPKQQTPAKLPSKPLPPQQAVKEAQQSQQDGGRGRGVRGARGGGRGNFGGARGRGREGTFQGECVGFGDRTFDTNRGVNDTQISIAGVYSGGGAYGDSQGDDGEAGRSVDRGRGRGRGRGRARGFFYGADGEDRSKRRDYDRRSGTGRGNELKRDGAGRGNWGAEGDEGGSLDYTEFSPMKEEVLIEEKKPEEETMTESVIVDEEKKAEEEEPEMSLDEYEMVLNEKRKALEAFKPEQRKVVVDKDFESMQLVDKKQDDTLFVKLGSEYDKGKKKIVEKEEKVKKSLSINEFLKPSEGEEYYSPSGRRGRGRGRGDRGGFRGSFRGGFNGNIPEVSAPSIADPGQFPTLGGMKQSS